jgi:hypothetical protein
MRHLLSRKEELGKTTAATIRICFIVKIPQFPFPGASRSDWKELTGSTSSDP